MANVSEDVPDDLEAEEIVETLAMRKAMAIAEDMDFGDVIIGADTIVLYDGLVFGKPEDKTDAFNMLTMLSGNWHEVYTGIAVVKGDTKVVDSVKTRVKFRAITEDEIEAYIDTNEPMDKAGAYGIQGFASIFVDQIDEDIYNVVGLPLCKLSQILKESFGISIL